MMQLRSFGLVQWLPTTMRNLLESFCSILGLDETITVCSAVGAAILLLWGRNRAQFYWITKRAVWLPVLTAMGLLIWGTQKTLFYLQLLEQGNALSAAQRELFEAGFGQHVLRMAMISFVSVGVLWWCSRFAVPTRVTSLKDDT